MISMMSVELKLTLCDSVASQSHVSCVPIVPINIDFATDSFLLLLFPSSKQLTCSWWLLWLIT